MSLDAYIAEQGRQFDTFRQRYAMPKTQPQAPTTTTRYTTVSSVLPRGESNLQASTSRASLHPHIQASASAARITTALQQGFPHERDASFATLHAPDASLSLQESESIAPDAIESETPAETRSPVLYKQVAPTRASSKRFSHSSEYAAFREILIQIDDDAADLGGPGAYETEQEQEGDMEEERSEATLTMHSTQQRHRHRRILSSGAQSLVASPDLQRITTTGGIQIRKLGPAPWQMEDEDSELEEEERRLRATERAVADLAIARQGSMGSDAEGSAYTTSRSRTASGDSDLGVPGSMATGSKAKPRKRSMFGFMKRVAGSFSGAGGSSGGALVSEPGSWSRKGSGGSTATTHTTSRSASPSLVAPPVLTSTLPFRAASPSLIQVSTTTTTTTNARRPQAPERVSSDKDKALPACPLSTSVSGQHVAHLIASAIQFEEPLSRDRLALSPALHDPALDSTTRRMPLSASVPQLAPQFAKPDVNAESASSEADREAERARMGVYDAADAIVSQEHSAQHEAMLTRRREDSMLRMFDHIVMQS